MVVSSSWQTCRRLLCIRPDNLGDVLMTTPALRALKEAAPDRHLTLLTSSAGAGIARLVPEVNDVLTFDAPWVSTSTPADPQAVDRLVGILRAGAFDGALIFTVQSQNPLPTALICYLAGIPRVLGFCRENPYGLLTEWVPDPEVLHATRHEVQRQLALVAEIGSFSHHHRLSLTVPPGAEIQARQGLVEGGVRPDEPWLLLHAGVSESRRRYPAADYVRAAQRLIAEFGYQIVLTGSAGERAYVQEIAERLGPEAFNLAGAFALETFAGLVAQAPVLIANNTGPVHIAAALGTPVVVLYAKTNPQHTPWQVPSRVLYFEVPPELRSRNVFLRHFPGPTEPVASPEAIVQAVHELVGAPQTA